jgi:D-alanyl-D-alanine carboxypeptidase/D-alanyl-D-alanine-endopeptidase (penicillin-binding protein 4)
MVVAVTAAPAMPPDTPARTPVAKAGTAEASKDSISRKSLQHRLATELRSAGASSSAYVWDIDANHHRQLFSSSARKGRIPASNEKLFTTAATVARLGARGQLETRVYQHGHRRGRNDHVLHGNLIIVGDGDPALGTRAFARNHNLPLTPLSELAGDVEAAGIGRVTGSIRADDHIFDRKRGIAATGGHPNADLSPLSGLSFNSGFANGHYARNPELQAAKQLKAMLRKRGVKVEGGVGRAELRHRALERDPLGLVRSPRIGSLIAETNKPSNNFFAEMLLKRLAARGHGRGTTARGAHKVERFAKHSGSGVHAVDGSGLGRGNRVTTRQVVRLLTAMTKRSDGKAYRHSLPIAGREGTVANRMRGTAAQDRCRTKTGTLHDVSALSGYCRAGHGLVAFSILMNSVSDFDAAHRAQDHMAALIARYRR